MVNTTEVIVTFTQGIVLWQVNTAINTLNHLFPGDRLFLSNLPELSEFLDYHEQ
ncbi:MAG: hypothetical protein IIA99_02665 [Proteobacteria bacterium]|nr:hypothetical protein [Pseudomonadota bacterium]